MSNPLVREEEWDKKKFLWEGIKYRYDCTATASIPPPKEISV